MEYRLLHHWKYALAASEHHTLEQAIALTEQKRDGSYLRQVAAFIAKNTQVQYVLIGALSPDGFQIETKAFIKDYQEQPNIAYPLQHTPCDHVITQRFCYYPNNVQQLFPFDIELQELNIESYLGSIFLDENNEPMGLIALMSDGKLQNAAFAEHLVLVLSPSIEEELLRSRHNPPAV
jgi:hypothetical protein